MIVVSDAVDEPWSMAVGSAALDDEVAAMTEDAVAAREWRELVWDSGERYVGEWLGDLMDGKGTWFGVDGERYEGEWRDGERHGRGVYTDRGGETYDGQWEDGAEHGQGLYNDPEHGWIFAVWDEGEAVSILNRGKAGVAPPSLEELDGTAAAAAAADGSGRGDNDDDASAVGGVSKSGHGTGHGDGTTVGKSVDSSSNENDVHQANVVGPSDVTGAATDIPQTVDDVMECLRKELKNRRAMGNAKGFFTFFDA